MSAISSHTFSGKDFLIAAGLIFLAFLIRAPKVSYPSEPVFDEIYFTNFGIQTLNGQTNIDVHPPFIRLVFAGLIKISNFTDLGGKIVMGEDYGNFPYVNLRLLTVIAGSLLAGVIFLLSKKIYGGTLLALLPAIFIIFDGALVSYSRAILYDTYILLFGFLGILLLWQAIDSESKKIKILFFLLSGLSVGLTSAIKWNGLAFWASGILLIFIKRKFKLALPFILLAFLAYFGVFLALYGTANINHFYEVQKHMFLGHLSVTEHHPAQSLPWRWPLAIDTFILWGNGKDDIIRLSPNVFSWTAAFVSIFFSIYIFLREKSATLLFLLGSYFANFLPFFLISRPLFLYHYFPALVFSYLMVPFAFKFLSEMFSSGINKRHIYAVVALNILFFLVFIPFIY